MAPRSPSARLSRSERRRRRGVARSKGTRPRRRGCRRHALAHLRERVVEGGLLRGVQTQRARDLRQFVRETTALLPAALATRRTATGIVRRLEAQGRVRNLQHIVAAADFDLRIDRHAGRP